MSRRLRVVGAVVAALAVGACGSGGDESLGPTATIPSVTTTPDPYAIPPVIDDAYVNRVLAGLDQSVGDVRRLLISTESFPPEAVERLKAIYLDQELLQLNVDVLQNDLMRAFAGIRSNPGNRTTLVLDLITATPECVFAKVDADTTAIFEQENTRLRTLWIGLVPTSPIYAENYNPTRWGYIYEGFTRDLTAPEDPCPAR